MVIEEIIKELRDELKRIDKLIVAMDSLNTMRRRGRPPKLLVELRAKAEQEQQSGVPRKRKRSMKTAKPGKTSPPQNGGAA